MSKESDYPQIDKGWMETVDGRQLYFGAEPRELALMIHPESVAWSLSMLCRYNGHTKRFYSVAEHASIMADRVYEETRSARKALTALHHDDAEHILGDMVSPIKATLPDFQALEERVDEAVSIRFGTIYPLPAWLKEYDCRICVDERAQVMNRSHHVWWCDDFEGLGVRTWNVMGRFHWYVREQWLKRHRRWTKEMRRDYAMGVPGSGVSRTSMRAA